MSALTRLAAADTRISTAPSLALNAERVPGGLGAVPLDHDVTAGGLVWAPGDAAPWAAPIGYALASEGATDGR